MVPAHAGSSDLQSELMRVADEVDGPRILSTITVGDMAPSNVLLGLDGPVFLDFEYCGIRSGFLRCHVLALYLPIFRGYS